MQREDEARAIAEAAQITMTYRNWRGEISRRTIQPWGVRFDATDWHPEPQWLLEAWDFDKQAVRDFALADCQFTDLKSAAVMDEAASESDRTEGLETASALRSLVPPPETKP